MDPLVDWRFMPDDAFRHALTDPLEARAACGRFLLPATDWRGTGSQAECDRLAELPACKDCAAKVGDR